MERINNKLSGQKKYKDRSNLNYLLLSVVSFYLIFYIMVIMLSKHIK